MSDSTTARPEFGPALARRVEPRQRLVRTVVGRAAGDVLRRSVQFAADLALSSTARWARSSMTGADVDHLAVRPPIDYWPWPDEGSVLTASPAAAAARPIPADSPFHGNDRLATVARLAGLDVDRYAGAPARSPAPAVARRSARRSRPPRRRGLPIAAARRGRTAAGPGTEPGAIVAGLRATLDATPPAPDAAVRRTSGVAPASAGSAAATGTVADRRAGSMSGGAPPRELPPDLGALRSALTASGKIAPRREPSPGAAAGATPSAGLAERGGPASHTQAAWSASPDPGGRPGGPGGRGGIGGPATSAGSGGTAGLAAVTGVAGSSGSGGPTRLARSAEAGRSTGSVDPFPTVAGAPRRSAGPGDALDRPPIGPETATPADTSAAASGAAEGARAAGSILDADLVPAQHDPATIRRVPTESTDAPAPGADLPDRALRPPANWVGSVSDIETMPTQHLSGRTSTGTPTAPADRSSVRPPAAVPNSNPPATGGDPASSTDRPGPASSRSTIPTQNLSGPTSTGTPTAPADRSSVRPPAAVPNSNPPATGGDPASSTDRPGPASHRGTIPTQNLSGPTSTGTPTAPADRSSVRAPDATPTTSPTAVGRDTPPSSGWAAVAPDPGTTPTLDRAVDITRTPAPPDAARPSYTNWPGSVPGSPTIPAPNITAPPSSVVPAASPPAAGGEPSPSRTRATVPGETTTLHRAIDALHPSRAAARPHRRPSGTSWQSAALATAAAAIAVVRPPAVTGRQRRSWTGDHARNEAGTDLTQIARRGTPTAPSQPEPAWRAQGRRWRLGTGRRGVLRAADRPGTWIAAAVRPPVAPLPPGEPTPDGDPAPTAQIADLARRRADRPATGRPAGPVVGRDAGATVRRFPAAPTTTTPTTTRPTHTAPAQPASAPTATEAPGSTVRPLVAPSHERAARTSAGSAPGAAATAYATEHTNVLGVRPPDGPGLVGAVARGLTTTSSPAEIFAAELVRHRVERPRPLPVTYRPLATVIVGVRPVHVASGTASRRALAKVGKRAATTGDTIHLATSSPSPEVLAHELTHVAHPSPVARFFDDDDRSPEERQAERMASIMRRAPMLQHPAASTATIQRRVEQPKASPGTVTAADLAAQLTTTGNVIQRQIGAHRSRGRTAPPVLTAVPPVPVDAPPSPPMAQQAMTTDQEPGAFPIPDLSTQFDRILELLEERILRELERRGGRFRGGF